MIDRIVLRPAQPRDFTFCEQLCFAETDWINKALDLDDARLHEGFALQWRCADVRIITIDDDAIGWLQTARGDAAVFLGQLYLDRRFQRQGIGSHVMDVVIRESDSAQRAVTLFVAKINPAWRFYARLGFQIIHEDRYKFHMRREACSRRL